MNVRPLIGLAGALIATMAGDLNDQASAIALVNMRGGLGVGVDAGTWIESLYLSAQPIGMLVSAWFMVTLGLRRWLLVSIALVAVTSAFLSLGPPLPGFYALRLLQGLAGGLITPLLMDTALFVLPPPIKLYGLAVYALTATFIPTMTATSVAFWTDILDFHFVYYQAMPMCALGAVLVWYGLPPEEPQYERFSMFDWTGLLLATIGIGALTTMLFHGDRLDWFNSPFICVLALFSVVCIPLFLANEWFHPLPFLKLQMLARRNFSYGVFGLFGFIILMSAAGTIPIDFLIEVAGYRPLQAHLITLEIALAQLTLLPMIAFILDFPEVDARLIAIAGLSCIAAACAGCSNLAPDWIRDQFFGWQALQAVGLPMVAMPLLMLSTNEVVSKAEAPFASALVNFPRSVAEVVAVWLVTLVARWRGAFHYDRIIDEVGQNRLRLIQGYGVTPENAPPLLPNGGLRSPDALAHLSEEIQRQVEALTTADAFRIMFVLALAMIGMTALLPVRSLPPRLKFKSELT